MDISGQRLQNIFIGFRPDRIWGQTDSYLWYAWKAIIKHLTYLIELVFAHFREKLAYTLDQVPVMIEFGGPSKIKMQSTDQ